MTDGDRAFVVTLKAWKMGRYRVIKTDTSVFDQRHYGCGRRYDLGQRSEIEDRIKGHRLFRRHGGAEAISFLEQRTITLADHDDGARGLFDGDGVSDERVDLPFDSVLIGRLANQNLAQGGGQAENHRRQPEWRSFHRPNILIRLGFHRGVQVMRDSKTFLSAAAL